MRFRKEYAAATRSIRATGTTSAILKRDDFTLAERFRCCHGFCRS